MAALAHGEEQDTKLYLSLVGGGARMPLLKPQAVTVAVSMEGLRRWATVHVGQASLGGAVVQVGIVCSDKGLWRCFNT